MNKTQTQTQAQMSGSFSPNSATNSNGRVLSIPAWHADPIKISLPDKPMHFQTCGDLLTFIETQGALGLSTIESNGACRFISCQQLRQLQSSPFKEQNEQKTDSSAQPPLKKFSLLFHASYGNLSSATKPLILPFQNVAESLPNIGVNTVHALHGLDSLIRHSSENFGSVGLQQSASSLSEPLSSISTSVSHNLPAISSSFAYLATIPTIFFELVKLCYLLGVIFLAYCFVCCLVYISQSTYIPQIVLAVISIILFLSIGLLIFKHSPFDWSLQSVKSLSAFRQHHLQQQQQRQQLEQQLQQLLQQQLQQQLQQDEKKELRQRVQQLQRELQQKQQQEEKEQQDQCRQRTLSSPSSSSSSL